MVCNSFLNARNVLPSEICHQICQVYGDNAMSDGMVRKWVWMFNEGWQDMHDEAWSGCPSLVNDDLVCKVNERVRDDRHFTISDLSLHFHQISRTLLYDLKDAVQKWITLQAAAFYMEGIQKPVPRYDKCLNNGGECVEKYFEECRIW
jgi:hypothetical protein